MSIGRIFAGIGVTLAGGVAGGAIVGGIGAACGAASGATGAAILSAAGHAGHSVHEATIMSATGNGIVAGSLGTIAGLATGGAAALGLFGSNHGFGSSSSNEKNRSGCCGGTVAYVASQVIGGMVGYGVLMHAADITESFGNYVADVAVGSAVTAIPVSIGLLCCFGVVALTAVAGATLAAKAMEACDSEPSSSPRPGV